jgi:hypothetical protein
MSERRADQVRGFKIPTPPNVPMNGNGTSDMYPPVDWSNLRPAGSKPPRYRHKAVYPEDSILANYMDAGRQTTEGDDSYIIGSSIPLAGALLQRRVHMPWGARPLYPNVFGMVVGKPGDRKSSTINLSNRVARVCLPSEHWLPPNLSPESMFEEYLPCSDKLLIVDDANTILTDWKNGGNGERVASRFLELYDCNGFSESFMRNKKKESTTPRRTIEETSTSVLFGATFQIAAFQRQQSRTGLARRFLYYIADGHGRTIIKHKQLNLIPLFENFKAILPLRGQVTFSEEAGDRWEKFQIENRRKYNEVSIYNESLSARLSTEPTHVAKIAMIFEACQIVMEGKPITEIRDLSLKLAIEHVAENMRSAEFLDSIANRSETSAQAEVVLSTIRKGLRQPDSQSAETIYATKSTLTHLLCPNSRRPGVMTTDDLYRQIIPHLESEGQAKVVFKKGKLEVFAFPK